MPILFSCQGKQAAPFSMEVPDNWNNAEQTIIFVKWWAAALIGKLQIKYHKINGLGRVSRSWTLTFDSVLCGLKMFRGLMTWIFIYSGQASRVRNPLMAIINLSVKFSLLLNFIMKTFTPLSLGVHPSRNSFSGRPLVKGVLHGWPRFQRVCKMLTSVRFLTALK